MSCNGLILEKKERIAKIMLSRPRRMNAIYNQVLAIVVLLTLALAGYSEAGPTQGTKNPATLEPYKIGAIFSITGTLAASGDREYKGAKLYVDRLNKAGGVNGHPLVLVFSDAESKPEMGATAARKMIQNDKVLAIIGPESTGIMNALVSVVNEFKIPNVSGQGAIIRADFNGWKYPWNFTASGGFGETAGSILPYFAAIKKTKMALLASNDAVGQLMIKRVMPIYAPKYGIQIVGTERFNTEDKDLTVQLTKLRNLTPKPDVLFVVSSGSATAVAVRNFKGLGMDKEMLLAVTTNQVNSVFISQVGMAGDGVISGTAKSTVWKDLPDGDSCKKTVRDFALDYEKTYGQVMDWQGTSGANQVLHIVEAIKAVGPDPQKIRDNIENNQYGIQGIGFKFYKSKDNHIGLSMSDYVLVKLDAKKKKWVLQDFKLKD